MGEEIVDPILLVVVADKHNFYVGETKGDDLKIVSQPFKTLDEAKAEKAKKEKKDK